MIGMKAHLRLGSGLAMGLCLSLASSFAVPILADEGDIVAHRDGIQLAALARSPKLLDAPAILSDLRSGTPETAIIVTLRPAPAAGSLALQSQRSAPMPEAFERAGAPVFYDLQNQDIRTRLRRSVGAHISQVLGELDTSGMRITQRFSYQFGFAARVTAAALADLAAHPEVIRIEPDRLLEPQLRQGLALMGAELQRAEHDGSGVSIAICDTGIDTAHPQLGGGGRLIFNDKVIGGYDTGDNDADPRPGPEGEPHGTACAGIAAGDLVLVDDYVGGVAPGAKLYALKISHGTGGWAISSAMVAAWEWAISHQFDDPANPIRVISTSFGGGVYSGQSGCDDALPAMTTAAASAVAAGISLFASSGNGGECNGITWPACISYVNSVGAVYDADLGVSGSCVSASCTSKQPASACSTGYAVIENALVDHVSAYSNSASFLTLLAPSSNASTTDIPGKGGYSSGDYTATFGGTSAASPYAAGAAAVLQSAAKAKTGAFLSPAEVRLSLTDNGDDVTDGKTALTKPRINLARAVAAVPSDLRPALFGRVTGRDDGRGLSAVTVSCDNGGGIATTNCAGDYRLAVNSGWSGTCTPRGSAGGFFTPSSRRFDSVDTHQAGQDYSWGCTSTTTEISPGAILNGRLEDTHCYAEVRPSGHFYDVFRFAAKARTTYDIGLTSTAFNAYLSLTDAAGAVLAEDDDGGGDGNARIRYTPNMNGELWISAMSAFPGETGAYAVSLVGEAPTRIPVAPGALTAAAVSPSTITLGWRDNATNESAFQIQRRVGSGPWVQIAAVEANITDFNDAGLLAKTGYAYRVRASNAAGSSAYSNVARVKTPAPISKPAAPTMLRVAGVSASEVTLIWHDNSPTESGFQIERKLGSGNWVQIGGVGTNLTRFADGNLNRTGAKHHYRVRAYNAAGVSGYSNQASVIPR